MKNLKFTLSVGLLLMIIVVGISSCKKEKNPLLSNHQTEESSGKGDDEPMLKSIILGSNGLPTYTVSSNILNHFQHYCQLKSDDEGWLSSENSTTACGPTSYMMAASCLARYLNPNTTYNCNGQKLSQIFPIIKNYVGGGSITLPSIKWYADNYDYSFISTAEKYTTNRESMKTFIKDALGANKFVIASINCLAYSQSNVNNSNLYLNNSSNKDLNITGNITTGTNKNYIVSLNEDGSIVGQHIIIIIKFVQTANDGSGYIEYIDPLANTLSTSNRRYVSFSRLLDSMAWNGSYNTQYDAISIGLI